MKELSIEQKAKAYDKAIERAKTLYENANGMILKKWVEQVFPELKESEDEKIKKEIIEYVKTGTYRKDWVAWLEKQGEQKSTSKIEPKFKKGQWIVFNGLTLYVNEVVQGYYRTTSIGGIPNSYDWDIDNVARLWTIQDAKNGDVLASELSGTIMLYKGIRDNNIQFYCDYDFSDIDVPGNRFAINNGQHYGSVDDSDDWHPATKEQCDLLFQNMKEAGYEWDAEKKS